MILFLFIACNCLAQTPVIQWEQTYGGGQMDEAFSIFNDQYGNFLVGGEASSHALVFSIDNLGNQNWLKRFGGTYGTENASQILRSFDGNIIFAGRASSTDGDVVGLHGALPGDLIGEDDYWVVCLDTLGNILWQNCLGGNFSDVAYSIVQSPDSGYLIFGNIGSNDGQVNVYYGIHDLWIAKLSRTGLLQWRKTYGGSNNEIAGKIISTNDGGFIFCSSSRSFDYDVSSNFGAYDAWIVKLSSTGLIQWQQNYGGSSDDFANDIIQQDDGSYFVVGNTSSTDFDINDPKGQGDILVMKIDSLGSLIWSRCLGGSQNDAGFSLCSTVNGVEVVGYTYSDDSTVSGNHGYNDVAAFEIDNNGNLLWSKCLGGSNVDVAYSVVSTSDGGSAIGGYTLSLDGDVSGPITGNEQAWVIKLSPNPVNISEKNYLKISFGGVIKNGTFYLNYLLNKNKSGMLSLYDLSSKLVFEKKITLSSASNNIQFPCNVSTGLYVIKFENNDEIISKKIIAIDNY